MFKQTQLLLIVTIFFSCNNSENLNRRSVPKVKAAPIMVKILPLGDVPQIVVINIYSKITRVIKNVELLPVKTMPLSSFYIPRSRYRADSLIHWMNKMAAKGDVYLGITLKDISTTKGSIIDYGVMGLGFMPGNACIVSNFRLKDKNNFYKVALHELAHTSGLPHCNVPTCFMRDAKGKDPTAMETAFCPNCKSLLQSKGWIF